MAFLFYICVKKHTGWFFFEEWKLPTQTPWRVLCGGLPWVLCKDIPPMRSQKT